MNWDELWSFYRSCENNELRASILNQIQLKNLIKDLAPRIQYEILAHAPKEVYWDIRNLIQPYAKKRMGLITAKDIIKMAGMFK